jgi:hypothetical protein
MRKHLIPLLLLAGCDSGGTNVLGGVPSMIYIQRTVEETGNVFDYAGGGSKANLFSLTPPTASGVKKNLTNWTDGDVTAVDLSFDARELVFSGRAPGEERYHVFRINVDGTNPCDAALGKATVGPCQVTDGPSDEVYPIYIPGGRIFFVTNQNVEGPAVPQFRDEYERATTAQAATMNIDGSDIVLGPRNVSHRVFPTLLADGRVMLTEWRHLGDTNEGDLTILNQDLTGVREAFGREGKGLTNNYLRAHEVSPGKIVTIGAARDMTYQAGKILLVNLGGSGVDSQSEALSSVSDLTPSIPSGEEASFKGIGRYYDALPLRDKPDQYLVSWADGPVQSEILGMAKASPDFGIYVYDAKKKELFPVVNEIGSWEFSAIAVVKRPEPPSLKGSFSAQGTSSTLLSAINVTDSSIFSGFSSKAVKVRITEGFSSEEGFPNDFGLTEFDGMALLGEADVAADGSFKALVPANTPVRMQLIDKYGMAIIASKGGPVSEPLWIQGRAGEARVCGGCHEDRTKTIQIAPGSSALQALGAAQLDFPGKTRLERASTVYTADKVVGVPWDKALQPIFDAKCVDCHDGSAGAANPSYTLTDMVNMATFTFTFNLKGDPVTLSFGEMMYTYSASHVSLLGPEMALRETAVMVTMGELKSYIVSGSAAQSTMIKMLNPPARYPTVNLADRAFGTQAQHPAETAGSYNGHDRMDPKYQLTADEYYLLQLMADNGAQYYSRENNPGGGN